MFGLNRKEETEGFEKEIERTPIIERPKPKLVVVEKNPIGEYEELAKELNYNPMQLLQEQIMRFFNQENMKIFDYKEVDIYLRSKCNDRNQVWVWEALRQKDKDISLIIHGGSGHGHYSSQHASPHGPYNKLVPFKVLQDVKKIEDKFKDKVGFFVSDFEHLNFDDPFIMLTNVAMETIIFGVWDEPGFK